VVQSMTKAKILKLKLRKKQNLHYTKS
jgi:hypothetical protein